MAAAEASADSLSAHVLLIRNTIRHLQGKPPVEETDNG